MTDNVCITSCSPYNILISILPTILETSNCITFYTNTPVGRNLKHIINSYNESLDEYIYGITSNLQDCVLNDINNIIISYLFPYRVTSQILNCTKIHDIKNDDTKNNIEEWWILDNDNIKQRQFQTIDDAIRNKSIVNKGLIFMGKPRKKKWLKKITLFFIEDFEKLKDLLPISVYYKLNISNQLQTEFNYLKNTSYTTNMLMVAMDIVNNCNKPRYYFIQSSTNPFIKNNKVTLLSEDRQESFFESHQFQRHIKKQDLHPFLVIFFTCILCILTCFKFYYMFSSLVEK